jgi:hypothetical protein
MERANNNTLPDSKHISMGSNNVVKQKTCDADLWCRDSNERTAAHQTDEDQWAPVSGCNKIHKTARRGAEEHQTLTKHSEDCSEARMKREPRQKQDTMAMKKANDDAVGSKATRASCLKRG